MTMSQGITANLWNCAHISKPATASCRYDCSEIGKLGNLKAVADLLNEITLAMREKCSLDMETAFLSRMIYRVATIHRNDKQLQSLQKVKKCLLRINSLKIDEVFNELYIEMKTAFQSQSKSNISSSDKALGVYMPSRQMFEYGVVRIQGLSRLLVQCLRYCYDSFHYTLQKVYLGHFLNVNVIFLSTISRLWVLLRLLLIRSIEWYPKLLFFVKKLKGINAEWLSPKDTLPENLEDWLGPECQQYLKHHQLQSSIFPKNICLD